MPKDSDGINHCFMCGRLLRDDDDDDDVCDSCAMAWMVAKEGALSG